jgi:hypothetical protein
MRPIISKSSSGTAEWQLDAAMAVAVLASGTLTGLLEGLRSEFSDVRHWIAFEPMHGFDHYEAILACHW